MPTYEYICSRCQYRFDVFQKISEAALSQCPECSGPLRRLINGGSGMIFKGSGFYITDYKKENKAADKGKGTAEKKEKSAADAGKTEAV